MHVGLLLTFGCSSGAPLVVLWCFFGGLVVVSWWSCWLGGGLGGRSGRGVLVTRLDLHWHNRLRAIKRKTATQQNELCWGITV